MKKKDKEIVVVLPEIRSSYNIGSIFRTSDAAGVNRIILSGYSPCPTDKFNRPQKEIAKTALGAELHIPWVYFKSTKAAIQKLKEEGFQIVAIEQSEDSKDYRKVKLKNKVAFVFGNEVEGLSKEILSLCDVVAEIPMNGFKESLNVSVSAGIALFQMLGK
jgi:tRNA G18 (ribose-2'-O)-methylase SpoU